jgi:hypothetical protein
MYDILLAIGRALNPNIQVFTWCDECEHVAPVIKRRRKKEFCGCCGLELRAHADEIDYDGTN